MIYIEKYARVAPRGPRPEEAVHRRLELAWAGFMLDVRQAAYRRGRIHLSNEQVDRLDASDWQRAVARWMATRPNERSAMPRERWRSSPLSDERLAAMAPLSADRVDLYAGTVKGLASVFGSEVRRAPAPAARNSPDAWKAQVWRRFDRWINELDPSQDESPDTQLLEAFTRALQRLAAAAGPWRIEARRRHAAH